MKLKKIFYIECFLIAAIGLSCSRSDMWNKAGEVGVPRYTITYDLNGAESGAVPVDTDTYKSGYAAIVLDNTGNLQITGYTFTGWNTMADGTGTAYLPGSEIRFNGENIILYASWLINTYTVFYNGNGNTGGTAPAAASYNYGTTVTVADNEGNLIRIPPAGSAEAFKFGGWNTASDGTGIMHAAGSGTFTITGNITLYACWIKFEIRDTGPAGGLIFYDKGAFDNQPSGSGNSWRYLEAAPSDQSEAAAWNNGADIATGATEIIPGTGFSNTALITTAQGAGVYAAGVCGGTLFGYNDWFLPSKDELNFMYVNLMSGTDQYGIVYTPAGFFTSGAYYWSSTESNAADAWHQQFSAATSQAAVSKSTGTDRVRAVRSF